MDQHVIRWRDLCRRAVALQRDVLVEYEGCAASRTVATAGAGGDVTLQIDSDFERIVIDEIRSEFADEGSTLHVVSEELGTLGGSASHGAQWVVIDPVDGSKNAAQGIPQFSLSVAVADGPLMSDVWFGYVYDFGSDEEFVADNRGNIECNGRIASPQSASPYRIIGCESAEPRLLAAALTALDGAPVQEIRVVGSIAIALCYVALGRFDGLLTCKECRSVDAAAGQLIARQAGLEVLFNGLRPEQAALDLASLYRLVAGSEQVCTYLLPAQRATPLVPR